MHLFACIKLIDQVFSQETILIVEAILLNMEMSACNFISMLMRNSRESRNKSFS